MAEDQVDGWLAGDGREMAGVRPKWGCCHCLSRISLPAGSITRMLMRGCVPGTSDVGALVTLVTKETSTAGYDLRGWPARMVIEGQRK